MELIILLIALLIATICFLDSVRKESKSNKQCDSFSECSCSEWSSFSESYIDVSFTSPR